jgi:hypothetical protein
VLGSGSVTSEQYTSYNATPQELSTKGRGGNRSLYNYVSAIEEAPAIYTPPDNYHPDKISGDITMDSLQQIRNEEIGTSIPKPVFLPSNI